MSYTNTEDSKSQVSATIDMNGSPNEKIQLDELSPKEVKRTTVIFNENAHNSNNKQARHSEQIGNLEGYFQQKQANLLSKQFSSSAVPNATPLSSGQKESSTELNEGVLMTP